jgi:hypothetical protein
MTVRAVPDWLDLNAIVSAELRDRMRSVVDQLAALEPTLVDPAAESVQLRDAYSAAVHDADADEILDQLGTLSGFDRLFEAWMAVIERACGVTDSVPV